MIQNQIVEYIKSQVQAGVSVDSLRSSLNQAGWPPADVEDSIRSAASPQGAPAAPAASKASPNADGEIISLADFNNQKVDSIQLPKEEKPAEVPSAAKEVKKKEPLPLGKFIMPVLGVICLAAIAAAGFFFYKLNASGSAMQALKESDASLNAKVASQAGEISAMTKTNADLNAKIDGLNADKAELVNELSFFVAPAGLSSSTPSDLTATVKGVLSVDAKNQYIVTTALGAKINVKNSRDQKVDTALKPLIGTIVEIGGTHPAGSNSVAVTSVNGAATVNLNSGR